MSFNKKVYLMNVLKHHNSYGIVFVIGHSNIATYVVFLRTFQELIFYIMIDSCVLVKKINRGLEPPS